MTSTHSRAGLQGINPPWGTLHPTPEGVGGTEGEQGCVRGAHAWQQEPPPCVQTSPVSPTSHTTS